MFQQSVKIAYRVNFLQSWAKTNVLSVPQVSTRHPVDKTSAWLAQQENTTARLDRHCAHRAPQGVLTTKRSKHIANCAQQGRTKTNRKQRAVLRVKQEHMQLLLQSVNGLPLPTSALSMTRKNIVTVTGIIRTPGLNPVDQPSR
jgi:hypothetical protein